MSEPAKDSLIVVVRALQAIKNSYCANRSSVMPVRFFFGLAPRRREALPAIRGTILEPLPWVAIQLVAQFAIVVHFCPAIPSPFASCHVDHEIAILLMVVKSRVKVSILTSAGTRWKGVDLSLRDERRVRPDPWLCCVEILERVLFFVLPFHMFLLVADRVPPDIQ